ncbi:MAG: hypothetical protein WBC71_03730 [Salaquimonas sp.]
MERQPWNGLLLFNWVLINNKVEAKANLAHKTDLTSAAIYSARM